jgi:hypothetical protein
MGNYFLASIDGMENFTRVEHLLRSAPLLTVEDGTRRLQCEAGRPRGPEDARKDRK